MFKKIQFLSSFLLISSLLMSCNTSDKHISFFYYSSNDNFITSLAKDLNSKFSTNYQTSQYFAENSQALQNKQITDEINEGTNLLVVNLFDRLSASSIIEKAQTKNIPVIFINREPLINDIIYEPHVYYVGTDPIYEGTQQAQIVNELFGGYKQFKGCDFDKNGDGKIQTFMIKGELGHQDSELRTNYSLNTLKSLGYEIDLLQTKTCDWDSNKAKAEFGKSYPDFLDENGNSTIELLLSNNDDMAFGVIDFLKTLDDYDEEEPIVSQYFPIVGVNGTEAGIKSIQNGELYGTVKNDFKSQADAIFKLAERLINKESLEDFEYLFDNERFIHIEGIPLTFNNINKKVD